MSSMEGMPLHPAPCHLRPVIVLTATLLTAAASLMTAGHAPATTASTAASLPLAAPQAARDAHAGHAVAVAPAAASAGAVYSGRGWKANTASGIYSLPNMPFTIAFATTTARTKLAAYFKAPVAQIKAVTGIPFTVTTLIDTTPLDKCPSKGRIIVRYEYRPTGVAGQSSARTCSLSDGSAWGGHIRMNSEYWSAGYFPAHAEAYRKNVSTHELGHVAGLAHPNQDLNHDGKVGGTECVKTSTGTRPIMCATVGGYLNSTDAGKFTPPFDVPGLRQMARNWYLRQN